jgi:ATP-grasp domain/L-amino acid ligase C-terminal domain 2/ATP-grasp N-terminal domain
MTRVLLVATTTGYQTRAFGEAAERLGIDIALATDRCKTLDDPWRDRAIPVRFHDEEASVEAIVREAERAPFAGVLAMGDRPVIVAAHAAAALGLRFHPPDAARAAHNKRFARERLRNAGLAVPWFASFAIDDPAPLRPGAIGLPAVVKPLVLSGSRGVIRANTAGELAAALERVARLLRSREVRALREADAASILIEGYIPGHEYAVEGLLERGRLRVLAIFDKPDPLEGPFFEETIYVTPSRASAERQRAIESAVAAAAAAIGLRDGPIHAECRIPCGVRLEAEEAPPGNLPAWAGNYDVADVPAEAGTHDFAGYAPAKAGAHVGGGVAPAEAGAHVYVFDVAARPIGGLCARALRFTDGTTDIPFEELLLRHAIGEPSSAWAREAAASGVLMIPIPHRGVYRRVDGLDAARAMPGITDIRITARPDQLLVPLPEGASYLGFIFARADGPASVERALRAAHARLAFAIDRPMPMVTGVDDALRA